MRTIGTCRLCTTENVELCRSHIFPEFLYREVYDSETKSFHVYSSAPNWRPSSRRKGIYEALLCRECEELFRDWETYACEALFNGLKTAPDIQSELFVVKGVEYKKFKLFLISLIWRAGVSGRSEFANVKLGSHEERMRQMLMTHDPGDVLDYPVALFVMRSGTKAVMAMPEAFKPQHGWTGYRATMAGLTWMFITERLKHFPNMSVFLNRKGELPLIKDKGKGMVFMAHRASNV